MSQIDVPHQDPSADQLKAQSEVHNRAKHALVKPLRIGIVAGEVSGDLLGSSIMREIEAIHPQVEWFGVGGESMEKAGLSSLFPLERLSKMGLVEVLKHLPDLIKAKRAIVSHMLDQEIDLFIGIDAPDMNLKIAKTLKEQGVYTVQYVSPSIWAWREKRIETIKASTDLVLCLFPFELPIYERYAHPACVVGHPALERIKKPMDMQVSRRDLIMSTPSLKEAFLNQSLSAVIGLIPGSRVSEVQKHIPLMLSAARQMLKSQPKLEFVIPALSAEIKSQILSALGQCDPVLVSRVHVIELQSAQQNLEVMAACDVLAAVSGTVTFEAMLLGRPMTVIYQMNWLTHQIARRLIKTPYVSLPNILANDEIVPELIQHVTAEDLAGSTLSLLFPSQANRQVSAFKQIRKNLQNAAKMSAGAAVLSRYFYQ